MGNKVILWGAGQVCANLMRWKIRFLNMDIVAVVDSDEKKIGTYVGSYRVENPEIISEYSFDKIIVAVKNEFYKEIQQHIIETFGIDKNRIIHIEKLFIVNEDDNFGSCQCLIEPGIYDIDALIDRKVVKTNNDLEKFFFYGQHRLIHKFVHYFEIYESNFGCYRHKKPKILEIGVFRGGSLQMWKNYFGEGACIYGADIDNTCLEYEEDGIKICIGSQDDEKFLKEISDKYGPFDIVIDDGSHLCEHQIKSFEYLFPLLAEGGVYLCEDVHTSYETLGNIWNGGFRKKGTFIEYAKSLIDDLYRDYVSAEDKRQLSSNVNYIKNMHFYENIVVVKKEYRGKAQSVKK